MTNLISKDEMKRRIEDRFIKIDWLAVGLWSCVALFTLITILFWVA